MGLHLWWSLCGSGAPPDTGSTNALVIVPPGVEGAMAPTVTDAVGDVWGHEEAASRSLGLPEVWVWCGIRLQGLGPREQGPTAGNPELTCPGADRAKV